PQVTVLKIIRRAIGMLSVKLQIPSERSVVSQLGGPDRAMRNLLQVSLDFPNVAHREPPIVIAQLVQGRYAIAGDPCAFVDVRIDVGHHQVAYGSKHGTAPVQRDVARPRDRTETTVSLEKQQNVIELVLRFDADEDRRISVLFQDDRGDQRAL